jgi:hypothetical protein
MAVTKLAGVPSALAIGVRGGDDIYVAAGFLIGAKSNPLHAHFFADSEPRRPPAAACRQPRRLRGRAVSQPTVKPAFELKVAGERIYTTFHADTQLVGSRRAGLAYLPLRTPVRVHGRDCADPEGGRRFVADRLVVEQGRGGIR